MTLTGPGHARTHIAEAAVALALLAIPGSAASAGAGRIVHSPPSSVVVSLPLTIEIAMTTNISPADIDAADVIIVRADGTHAEVPLFFSTNALFGEIPGALVNLPELSYYLRVIHVDGLIETAPPGAPVSGTFRIPVSPSGMGSGIEIVSPTAGEIVSDIHADIAALFVPPLEEPWDAIVLLDGRDVTSAAAITSDLVVLVPEDPLSTGRHRVTISALTEAGSVEQSWIFAVGDAVTPAGEATAGTEHVAAEQMEQEGTADPWRVIGRVEVGWATVSADTTSADSLDVALPYNEVSDPAIDLYVSGFRSDASYLVTAQYDPVYNDEFAWQADLALGTLEFEVGHIYPSLSSTTLDWASGFGAGAVATVGRGHAELVALRISDSDTLDGYGLYSRYALGGSAGFDWSDRFGLSLAHVSTFDDESSISESDRITDPLTNHVTAGIIRGRREGYAGELEFAVSSASAGTDSSGVALHAEIIRGAELDDHVALEFWTSEVSFYSAGSLEQKPGESALRLGGAWGSGGPARVSGWMRLSRDEVPSNSESGTIVNTYARTDVTWALGDANLRSYAVARYDHSPGIDDDYIYGYASIGTTWRLDRTRAVASASWSRSQSQSSDRTDLWTLSVDLRQMSADARWSGRAAGRWSLGSGDETEYTRSHYTLEATVQLGTTELRLEYWLIDRSDRAEIQQSYMVHVLRAGLGYSF